MHLTGLAGEPRHYSRLTGIPGSGGALSPAGQLLAHTLPLNRFITYAAIFLATAQILFLINFFHSLHKGRFAASNPWQATTLEWHPAWNPFALLPASDTPEITVHCAPCLYFSTDLGDAFNPQWVQQSVVQPTIENATDTKPE
jgi:cytochrome c oxidase subunit 1